MRKVSIYVLDPKKNKILVFLEKWYFKQKRKMNEKEIREISQLLQMGEGEMRDF